MRTVIGIDVGTQSTKVVFYDYENKRIAATGSASHDILSGDDGTSEQEASWWISAIQESMSRVPAEIRETAVAVGVSGQQHGFVPLDKNGNVLYRVKLWNDTSTVAECEEITRAFGGEEKLFQQAGNLILPGYTAAKILWLKKHKPELFARMAHVLLPHDYVNFVLTGEYSMEYGDASGTGLLNIRDRSWNAELCGVIDPKLITMLPEPRAPGDGAGTVSGEAAERFGIPRGIPVSTGGGDNMMAALGTGTVRDGQVSMSLGTSGTLFAFSSKPIIDSAGTIAAFCSSNDGWLPLLCTMNCTVATEQTRKLFDVDVDQLDALVGSVPPGSNGVTVLPFFTGERVPNLPFARASIMGLSSTNTGRENILKASMEAAIYGMRLGLNSLSELGLSARQITLTGGGSKSRVWRQLAADITGVPVRLPNFHDSAALGAALQALWYRDVFENTAGVSSMADYVEEHTGSQETELIEPGKNRDGYQEGYKRYARYIELLTPLYK
ncbi:xylulokinase [Marispirochaeta aestuarii]|uniref:xylulokinase n=1 Tax=Marispirochaeta aestuarii TaxID=1963862 RepID=UPI0029C80F30|nr:xylulokinase [Marispirochaeta aestuarii]